MDYAKRLAELEELKKTRKLDDKEFKEYKKLQKLIHRTPKPEKPFAPGNDYSWWSKVPELIRDAVNLKSNWIAGTPLAGAELPFVPTGVARFSIAPTYGVNSTPTDPLNVWSRDLYLRMFQKWRGISSYSASDLAISIIAGVEFVKAVATAERIYGVVNRYAKRNVNMPYAELAALGVSTLEADYIRNHLSDFRYDLNVLIRRAQRLCVPKDMSIIANALSLAGYEYLDHDNAKGQIIIFDYTHFGVYDDTKLTTGGSIIFESRGNQFINTSDPTKNMFPMLEKMLNALLGSDSVQKIFGDLITWFGDEQLLLIEPLPEDYVVVPVFSESILHKMHNIETLPSSSKLSTMIPKDMDSADITALEGVGLVDYAMFQYNDCIYTQLSTASAGAHLWKTNGNFIYDTGVTSTLAINHAHIIDTYRVDPGDEVVVEGSLWKPVFSPEVSVAGTPTSYYREIITCAYEVVAYVTLYYMNSGVPTTRTNSAANIGTSIVLVASNLNVLDWAPLCYEVNASGYVTTISGDVDTPIPVFSNDLARIHTACVYSGLQTDIRVITSR